MDAATLIKAGYILLVGIGTIIVLGVATSLILEYYDRKDLQRRLKADRERQRAKKEVK